MTSYTINEVRTAGQVKAKSTFGGAREALRKSVGLHGQFDIFLSHSFQDAELILGAREILNRAGKRVYVDWINDPELDRTQITERTAKRLQERMDQCRSMVYVATRAATTSKWMPWELGYFNGRKGAESVAIMPLVSYQGETIGQEYLSLYSTVERYSSTLSSPLIFRRDHSGIRQKSLEDLVAGRGGSAWRTL